MNKLIKTTLSVIAILALSACGTNEATESKNIEAIEENSNDQLEAKDVIKIGVVGENNEVWEDVAKRYEEGSGKKLEIVSFSDYREPNEALLSNDIDINAFQHKKFLEDFNNSSNSDIVAIADTVIAPLGIYSSKIKNLDELEDNARIAIPDDPTNGARALFLLKSAGLIKVNGSEGDSITINDITENDRNFDIIELSAAQTARSLDDVDIAVVNSGMAVDAGFIPTEDAIYLEDHNDPDKAIYVNVIATTKENENSKTLRDLIDNYYYTKETVDVIEETTKGSSIPVFEYDK